MMKMNKMMWIALALVVAVATMLAVLVVLPVATAQPAAGFVLRSPEVADGGTLPRDYTGDGSSATLPLEWSGAPAGTQSYAVIMHHIPGPGTTKWYWVLYNIPATITSLPRNVQGIGVLGNNSVNGRTEYAPPHSKGPGPKTYIYTVYALSAPPQLDVPPAQVNRDVLLAAMRDRTLASAELHVVYTRPAGATDPADHGGPMAQTPMYLERTWMAVSLQLGCQPEQIAALQPTYAAELAKRDAAVAAALAGQDMAAARKALEDCDAALDARLSAVLSADQLAALRRLPPPLPPPPPPPPPAQ